MYDLGTDGFVKLVDFGFAKPVPYLSKEHELMFRTFTLCGTPDYMGASVRYDVNYLYRLLI